MLNRAERLGVIENVESWLQARKLRNRMVHEYMEAPKAFAEDLLLAKDFSAMLISTYNQIVEYSEARMGVESELLPPKLMAFSRL